MGVDPPSEAVVEHQLAEDGSVDQQLDQLAPGDLAAVALLGGITWSGAMHQATTDSTMLCVPNAASEARTGFRQYIDDNKNHQSVGAAFKATSMLSPRRQA